MLTIPVEIQLLFAGLLFLLGLVGVLVRRNIFFIMMSIEIMLNSAGLVFIIGSSYWKLPEGQAMFLFILAVAAAEVSIGLALILRIFHHYKSLDVEEINKLKDEE